MTMGIAEAARRLLDWLRQGLDEPDDGIEVFGGSELPDAQSDAVEWPWRYRWDHLPKRSAGFGFSGRDYDAARARAEEIARLTLGDELWTRVRRVGYVDLPSQSLSRRHLPPAGRAPHRSPLRPWGAAAVAAAVSLHQPDLPLTGGRVLRPPLPLRARQRGRADPGGGAATLGPAARPHLLDEHADIRPGHRGW